jgi:hypothetical protein
MKPLCFHVIFFLSLLIAFNSEKLLSKITITKRCSKGEKVTETTESDQDTSYDEDGDENINHGMGNNISGIIRNR